MNPLTIGYVKPCFIDKKKKTYKNISITGNTRKKKPKLCLISVLKERAQELQEEIHTLLRARSPDPQAQIITQLTPPHSGNKKSNTSKVSNTSFSSSELDSFEKENEEFK